ncbi:MAG: DUF5686 and carboxypeptidase regulatory-like domain-containing protein [Bacteroidia bacterium]|nr:DUF5686 and carboxypeptidase regulatory-like domain-containing protein [Bacteroidia bacterium]
MKHWLYFFALFSNLFFAQTINYTVSLIDQKTQKPIPFCPVRLLPVLESALTSLDGHCILKVLPGTYTLIAGNSFYEQKKITLNIVESGENKITLSLLPSYSDLAEVTVFPGKDLAEEMVKKCIERIPTFNPFEREKFYVQKVSRLKVMISDKNGNEDFYKNYDSVFMRLYEKFKKKLGDKFFYYVENHSEIFHQKGAGLKERVNYSFAPGFKKSPFSTFFATLQSFGFYDEEISLLDETYISPVSQKGLKLYRYRISDTVISLPDTFVVIQVLPRKRSTFSLLTGILYIHAKEYYLKGVDVKPSENAGKYLYATRQFYEKTNEGVLYPHQTDSYILVPNKSKEYRDPNGDPLFTKFRVEMKTISFRTDTVPDFQSQRAPFEEAEKMSERPLYSDPDPDSLMVRRTVHFSDSLLDRHKAEKKLNFISRFVTGYIPLGNIGLEWPGWINFNFYEGYAPGTAISSLSKAKSMWLFYAGGRYGTKDRDWKARVMAGYQYYSAKKDYHRFQAGWMKEIMENGALKIFPDLKLASDEAIRSYYLSNADKIQSFFLLYDFQSAKFWDVQMAIHRLTQQMNVIYRPGENNIKEAASLLFNLRLGFKSGRYRLESALGTFNYSQKIYGSEFLLEYKKTFADPSSSMPFLPVHRLDVMLADGFFPYGWWGTIFTLRAGYSFVSTPYHWLYHHHASRAENFSVSYPRGMETMFLNEFMSRDYVQANFSLLFKRIFPVNDIFNPELELVHNACLGRSPDRMQYLNVVMDVPQKIYTEAGLKILRITQNNFSSVGFGIFYRYGHYTHEQNKYNFIYKLAATYRF